MIKCVKCGEEKESSEFTRPHQVWDNEKFGNCKACVRNYNRAYYRRRQGQGRPILRSEVTQAKEVAIREFLRELRKVPCMDCGQRFKYYAMQFDHVRGKKVFGLGRALSHTTSLELVKTEVEKCDVVCANCHSIRTFERRFGVQDSMPS